MRFLIADVEVKVSNLMGFGQTGQRYTMTHVPSGEQVILEDPILVKNAAKEQALHELREKVEAYDETQDRG